MIKPIKEMKNMRARYYQNVNKGPGNAEEHHYSKDIEFGYTKKQS